MGRIYFVWLDAICLFFVLFLFRFAPFCVLLFFEFQVEFIESVSWHSCRIPRSHTPNHSFSVDFGQFKWLPIYKHPMTSNKIIKKKKKRNRKPKQQTVKWNYSIICKIFSMPKSFPQPNCGLELLFDFAFKCCNARKWNVHKYHSALNVCPLLTVELMSTWLLFKQDALFHLLQRNICFNSIMSVFFLSNSSQIKKNYDVIFFFLHSAGYFLIRSSNQFSIQESMYIRTKNINTMKSIVLTFRCRWSLQFLAIAWHANEYMHWLVCVLHKIMLEKRGFFMLIFCFSLFFSFSH